MGLNSPTRPQTVRLTPTATTIALPRSSSTGVSGPRVSSGDDNRGSHSHKLGWMSKSTAVHTDMDYVLLSKLEDSMQSMQRSVFAHLKPLEGSSNQYSHKVRKPWQLLLEECFGSYMELFLYQLLHSTAHRIPDLQCVILRI